MTRWSLIGDGFAGLWRWLRRRPLGADEFEYHRRSQLDLEHETSWIAAGGQTAVTLRMREPIAVRERVKTTLPSVESTHDGPSEPWTEPEMPRLPPLVGDPRMVRYVRPAKAPDEVAERQAHFHEHNPRQFRIVDADSGKAIGWMAYWNRTWNDELGFEIGWAIDPMFEGVDLRQPVLAAIAAAHGEGRSRFLLASPGIKNRVTPSFSRDELTTRPRPFEPDLQCLAVRPRQRG